MIMTLYSGSPALVVAEWATRQSLRSDVGYGLWCCSLSEAHHLDNLETPFFSARGSFRTFRIAQVATF